VNDGSDKNTGLALKDWSLAIESARYDFMLCFMCFVTEI